MSAGDRGASPSGDPIPAVTEAEARGETARLFADIRSVLGVRVVNLIFRHVATLPGALAWSWGALRPLYVSGAVERGAGRLVGGLALPDVPALTPERLHAAGLDEADRRGIVRVLDSYNRSNAMNLVALTGLVQWLRAGAPARSGGATPGDAAAALPAPVTEPLPPLLGLDDMPAPTRALVVELNRFGERGDGRVMATMYRQLAHWPGYIELVAGILRPLAAAGRFTPLIDATIARATAEADALGSWTPPAGIEIPRGDTRAALEQALDDFTSNTIARMVPVARILRAAMPVADATR